MCPYWPEFLKQKQAKKGGRNWPHVLLSWTNHAGDFVDVTGYQRRDWFSPLAVMLGQIEGELHLLYVGVGSPDVLSNAAAVRPFRLSQ